MALHAIRKPGERFRQIKRPRDPELNLGEPIKHFHQGRSYFKKIDIMSRRSAPVADDNLRIESRRILRS